MEDRRETAGDAAAEPVATAGSETVLHGVLGAAGAELVLLAGLASVRRSVLRDAYTLLVEAVRGANAQWPEDSVEPNADRRAEAPA
jgi:hypothetical protein